MKFDFGHGEEEIIVSVYTMVLYEQEFNGADLIQDLFGKMVIRKEDESLLADEDVIDVIDFTSVNWTTLTKVLWASLKTANPALPSYKDWASTLGEINLYSLSGELTAEIRRRLFRVGDTASN